MKCVICKTGQTRLGASTVTLQREKTVVVFRDVPAEICDDCGEYFLSVPVAGRIYLDADNAVERGVEVEVLRYVA